MDHAIFDSKKAANLRPLGSIFPLGNDRNFDDYLAVVLLKFVMAGSLVTVAGEHHIEHAGRIETDVELPV